MGGRRGDDGSDGGASTIVASRSRPRNTISASRRIATGPMAPNTIGRNTELSSYKENKNKKSYVQKVKLRFPFYMSKEIKKLKGFKSRARQPLQLIREVVHTYAH